MLCGDAGGNGNGWEGRLVLKCFSECGSPVGGDDNGGGDGDGGDEDGAGDEGGGGDAHADDFLSHILSSYYNA